MAGQFDQSSPLLGGALPPSDNQTSAGRQQLAPAAATAQGYTVLDFAHDLESALGVPQSANNDAVLVAWQRAEGNPGWGQYNPFNIAASSVGQGSGGTARWGSWQEGVQATANFIRHPYYSEILANLQANADPATTANAIGRSPWASGHYAFPQYSNGAPGGSIIANLGANGNYSPGNATGGTGGGTGPGGTGGGNIDPVMQQYGFLVNDPQIGPWLRQLNTPGGISDATFQALIQTSDWWKKNAGSARAWQEQRANDPASFRIQESEYARQIVEQASQLGIGLDPGTILKLADQWGMENWQTQDVTNAILGYSSAARASGGLAYGEDQIRKSAADYGINLNDQQAYSYELQVAKNQQTANGLQADFAQQAQKMYPHLADQLNQGFTLRDLATPYINTAASTLEIDPNSIDLSNPKWSRALAFHDGNQVRAMTQYEWSQVLMQDPTYGWDHTQNGQAAAASLGKSLVGTMTGTAL